MNRRNGADRLRAEVGDEERRLRRSARRGRAIDAALRRGGAAGDRDHAPSVRGLKAILGVVVTLISDVQVVGDAGSERVVESGLAALAEEVIVVARELTEADRAAAGLHAVLHVTIFVDERLHKRRLRRAGRGRGRNNEASSVGEIIDREHRAGGDRRHLARREVGVSAARIAEIIELERGERLRVDHPRPFEHTDLEVRVEARARLRSLDRGELAARLDVVGRAIAAVDQPRAGRRERQLSELLVALALVLRQRAVEIRRVVARERRPIVGAVEEEAVGDDRAADIHRAPIAILRIGQVLVDALLGDEGVPHRLEADFAGDLVRPRFADGVDLEAAGAPEIDCFRAAFDDVHLRHVVVVRLGHEDAEQRHRDVHAIEQVDVVLAAAARARAARHVLRHLNTGDELLQIAIVLCDRQRLDLLAGETALNLGRLFVDQRRFGGDGDVLRDSGHAELHVDRRLLAEEDVRLAGHRVHTGERVRQRVGSRQQRRKPVVAVGVAGRDAWLREHVRPRFYGDARQQRAVGSRDLPANGTRRLAE